MKIYNWINFIKIKKKNRSSKLVINWKRANKNKNKKKHSHTKKRITSEHKTFFSLD